MLAWAELRRDEAGGEAMVARMAREAAAHGAAAERFGRRVADRWLDLVTGGRDRREAA
jgi:hypothetical protein